MHDHCLNRNHGQRVYICTESDVSQRSKSTQILLQLICHLFSPRSTCCPISSVYMCRCLSLLQLQLLVTPPRLNKSLLPLFSCDVLPRTYQRLLELSDLCFSHAPHWNLGRDGTITYSSFSFLHPAESSTQVELRKNKQTNKCRKCISLSNLMTCPWSSGVQYNLQNKILSLSHYSPQYRIPLLVFEEQFICVKF